MHRKSIIASSNEEADRLLNAVAEELQHLARPEGNVGILVTKMGPGQFSLELSDKVPYGLTLETLL